MASQLEASEDQLVEIEDGEVAVSIARADVAHLTLGYGSAAERPMTQLAFGLVAAALACWCVWRAGLFVAAGRLGEVIAVVAGGGVIALVVAIALVGRALARRHFVVATLADGTRRKLLLPNDQSDADRAALAAELRALGWPVVDDVVS
jgi:hypothetical protein